MLRVPPDMMRKLEREAVKRASPIATVARQLVKDALDRLPEENHREGHEEKTSGA